MCASFAPHPPFENPGFAPASIVGTFWSSQAFALISSVRKTLVLHDRTCVSFQHSCHPQRTLSMMHVICNLSLNRLQHSSKHVCKFSFRGIQTSKIILFLQRLAIAFEVIGLHTDRSCSCKPVSQNSCYKLHSLSIKHTERCMPVSWARSVSRNTSVCLAPPPRTHLRGQVAQMTNANKQHNDIKRNDLGKHLRNTICLC